jgi:hypothetical protein
MVADRQADRRRTLGVCLEHTIAWVTLGPRTCAVRQDLEAWARPQPACPLVVETPGRTTDAAPRRWHGHSVRRDVEVEDGGGRVAVEALRVVVGHASPRAQPPTPT